MIDTGNNIILYGYKIADTCSDVEITINNIQLTNSWTDFKLPQEKLKPFIRSVNNLEGILDYREFNPITKQSKFDGSESNNIEPEIYSRDVLSTFKREQLVDICNIWQLNHVNKPAPLLVNNIIAKQMEYLASKQEDMVKGQTLADLKKETQDLYFQISDKDRLLSESTAKIESLKIAIEAHLKTIEDKNKVIDNLATLGHTQEAKIMVLGDRTAKQDFQVVELTNRIKELECENNVLKMGVHT
jgi:hypothetical protein